MNGDHRYSYEDAGFNGFFRRTLNGNPNERILKNIGSGRSHQPQMMNLDAMQVGGSMGDTMQVGRVHIEGGKGRIDTKDEEGNTVVRVGDREG